MAVRAHLAEGPVGNPLVEPPGFTRKQNFSDFVCGIGI